MGGACCVAAKDKNIVSGPSSDILHRNIRNSPTWSFRWDNRGRVAGEEASLACFSDANNGINQGPDIKPNSTRVSGDASPLDSVQRSTWQKSPASQGTAAFVRTPGSDQAVSRNMSIDSNLEQVDPNLEQVKESTESPTLSKPSPIKVSPLLPSTSATSTPPSFHRQSSSCVFDTRVPEFNESTRGSHGGSSDGWSMHAFSELTASSNREKWSFGNDSPGSNHEKSGQTCGVCSRLLTEKSLWSSQKLVTNNELSVVSVLICGHVYHAECLEILTPEISKYDPSCPVCTMGEKQARKLSRKAFKAEMDLKAKTRKSKNRVVDSDLNVDPIALDRVKSSEMPFLKRRFSFGLKASKSLREGNSVKKKGFFWTRSLKV